VDQVMREKGLGPNGGIYSVTFVPLHLFLPIIGLLYCLHYLEEHFSWLEERLQPYLNGLRNIIGL
jgi:hypothetical protein